MNFLHVYLCSGYADVFRFKCDLIKLKLIVVRLRMVNPLKVKSSSYFGGFRFQSGKITNQG